MKRSIALLLLTATIAPFADARAQDIALADPDPTQHADAPDRGADWQFRLGVGALYAPAFVGSKDYQLQVGPNVEVRYKDRLFLSVIDGIGFDLLKTDHIRAGPVVKYQQKRRQSGKGPFVLAGGRSDALRGLGSVPVTAEAGGYIEYQAGGFSAKAEVRQGIGGHDGLIADLGVRYTTSIAGLTLRRRPILVTVGPRTTIVDRGYNDRYFGVDAAQSTRSGLPTFDAKGGLFSYGVGGAVIVPLSPHLRAAFLGGFDRLAGDAARSPLVRLRGDRNQTTVGLGLTYDFGR